MTRDTKMFCAETAQYHQSSAKLPFIFSPNNVIYLPVILKLSVSDLVLVYVVDQSR